MKRNHFTTKQFVFTCHNPKTLRMMEYLYGRLRGKELNNMEFQRLIEDLVENAYEDTKSLLGV